MGVYEPGGRVICLQAPLGPDQTPITQAQFAYGAAHTEVYDALGNQTIYRFATPKRIAAIERYEKRLTGKQELYASHRYFWGEGPLEGCLIARGIANAANRHLTCMVGTYDECGNVLCEELYGNLTGQGQAEFELGKDYRPAGVECSTTRFQYSEDGFNLPIREEHIDGKIVCTRYLPGTDRPIARLTGNSERYFTREFYRYSADPLLIESIVDDGYHSDPDDFAGVTCRRITHYSPRYQAPAIGSPDTVVEAYLDLATGTEQQLRRTQYHYDARDLVIQEDHYDAHDELRYSLQYVYDEQRNLIAKTDPLGRISQMRYDANKNLIGEEVLGAGFRIAHSYDFSNRLIKTEEIHEDGLHLVTSFRHDYKNNKVALVDPYGNETRFVYDAFGREIEVIYPAHLTPEGSWINSSAKKQYNVLDQVIAYTDQNGNTTRTLYTIRGQPTQVDHPDGSQERCLYNLNGTLAKKWETNGLCHHYTYDVLGRVLRTESYDNLGNLQATLSNEYTGAHLIRTTDALENVIEYTYDGAGRKIAEIKKAAPTMTSDTLNCSYFGWLWGDERSSDHAKVITKNTRIPPEWLNKTTYSYDPLGRLSTTTRWYGQGPDENLVETLELDLGNRVIGMQVTDGHGTLVRKETYAYDIRGNKTLTCAYRTPTEYSIAEVVYDSRALPIRLIDDYGNITHLTYDYQYRNAGGQKVLCKTTTDPLGRKTTDTQDALGRLCETTTVDPLGNLLSQHHLWHNGTGQPIRRVDDIVANGTILRTMTTEWAYDSLKRIIQLREAAGTDEERTTTRGYNRYGQLEAIHLVDGIVLLHEYDPMGRLAYYHASDDSFAYRYQYDVLGNVLDVEDPIRGTVTRRQYDGLQRMVAETLANGLTFHYQYDAFNRVTQIQLPDQAAIAYTYDAANMLEVARLGANGNKLYAHQYLSHNLRGKALVMQLIDSIGYVTHAYDSLGRLQSIASPYHTDTIPEGGYDKVGNMVSRQLSDAVGQVDQSYSYDALNQLTGENGSTQHQYQNDSLNNRLSKDGTQYEINALNMLVRVGDTLYIHDRRGNLVQSQTNGQTTSYRYDALGRLLELETETLLKRYRYDSFNRRISQSCATNTPEGPILEHTERILYTGQNEIGALDQDNRISRLRLLGEGRGAEIGAAVAIELGLSLMVPLHDLCGNVSGLVLTEDGKVFETYRYSAFGEEQIYGPSGDPLQTSCNPWRTSSKYVDAVAGLVFFGRRYYLPATGRWLTPDPIGYEAGPNLYAYVHNNPLTHLDLYGLWAQSSSSGQGAYSGLKYACSLPGRAIEFVGRHIVPFVNIVRQAMMYVGRILSFRPAHGCEECREVPSHQYLIEGKCKPKDNVRFCCSNGILNNEPEGKSFGQEVSNAFGGIGLDGLYYATQGLVNDICKVAILNHGAVTRDAQALADHWTRLYEGMEGALRRIIHIAHSGGASLAYAARKLISDEVAKSIEFYGLGGAKMIPDGTFGKVRNIVNDNDFVSHAADPIGHLSAAMGKGNIHVEYVKGEGWMDHCWDGNYKNVITEIGREYQSS